MKNFDSAADFKAAFNQAGAISAYVIVEHDSDTDLYLANNSKVNDDGSVTISFTEDLKDAFLFYNETELNTWRQYVMAPVVSFSQQAKLSAMAIHDKLNKMFNVNEVILRGE